MTNGFEKHGIKHSSASQINMWANAPDAWAAKYLFGGKFKYGVAPLIGTLTESVVQEVLTGTSFDKALEGAEKVFRTETALNTNDKETARITNIKDMAELALEALKPYGEPEFVKTINGIEQQRIEIKCNGGDWQLPVIGYLDFVYPKHGLVIDLKTTLRCPSEMSPEHQRQAAIYQTAKGNFGVKFLYVTPKKINILEVDEPNKVMQDIKTILTRKELLLRKLEKEDIRSCIPTNINSFYWRGSEGVFKDVYG